MTRTEKLLLLLTAVFFLLALLFTPRVGAARQVAPAFEQPLAPTPPPAEDALYITLEKRVDINHDDVSALTALPGVGKTTAEAIVAYREEHGPFSSVEELLLVPGFGTAALEAILAAQAPG